MLEIDIEKRIVNGAWEGYIGRVNRQSIRVFTGKRMSGVELNNFFASGSLDNTKLKVYGPDGPIYLTYESIDISSPGSVAAHSPRVFIEERTLERFIENFDEYVEGSSGVAKAAAQEALDAKEELTTNVGQALEELDEVKAANQKRYLDAVSTVAERDSAYPTPENGDSVWVSGEGKMYRYDGTVWKVTNENDPSAIDMVSQQLAEKADGNIFRWQPGGTTGSESVINVVEGYEGNAIAPTIRGAVVSGGGGIGQENVIGGITTNAVPGNQTPNVVDPNITNAHYAVINGGYNSVNNALAGVLTGFHCIIEKEATHGTISGGSVHKIIDGDYSTIAGGSENTINVTDGGAYATISGGLRNIVTGKFATIAGGYLNEASGERSMVLGGSDNKAQAYGASVSGGFRNTASGNQSTVTGGQQNTASGSGSAVFNGRNNVASAQDSMVTGGAYNEAAAQDSLVRGLYGKSISRGQQVTGAGTFTGKAGEAQESKFVLRRQTTDATTQNLGVDGAGVVPTISAGSAWLFTANVIAKSGADIKVFRIEGIFNKEGTANAAVLGTPTITTLFESAGATAWSVGTLAGSSTLNIRITGEAGKTVNWVAKLETVEVVA